MSATTCDAAMVAPVASWVDVHGCVSGTTGPGGDRRTMTTEFVIGSRPITDDRTGEVGVEEIVVTLTTRHFGKAEYVGRPDKVYLAHLDYEKRARFDGHTVREYGLYTQQTALVQRADAPRYSAGTLMRVHDAALEHLAATYDTDLGFRRVFAEAIERHG